MTVKDIGVMLELLEANYGQKFYDGVNKENVVRLWAMMFKDDDQNEVLQAVINCVNTMTYKPTIADIRKRMAQAKMGGQLTATEAFQLIHKAVNSIYDKESATKAFNGFPSIVRKVVGSPAILISWSRVSEEAFMTVVMSAIRESYRELAQREFDYYALPKKVQALESWRVDAPSQEALPEPEKQKSIDEIIEEANVRAAEHGMQMTPELKQKHASRVSDFLKPMTEEDLKRIEASESRKFEGK